MKAEISDIADGGVWMPFHYAEAPTNILSSDALDPVCGITELKVCPAKVERVRTRDGQASAVTG